MLDYDTWKLSNNENDDVHCDHCERQVHEEQTECIQYNDEDFDAQELWLCEWCVDEEVWI